MTGVRSDLSFPHRYDVELIEEIPSSLKSINHIYFPGIAGKGGRDGLLVKLNPRQGLPWIGTFAFGYNSPKALTGIFSCPSELSLCVVSAGQGYIFKVEDPYSWSEVKSYPIVDVRLIVERELLVFIDFTTITAYGSDNMVWTTPRLSWDGLKITDVTSDYIKGLAWDSLNEQEVEFLVDIKTGYHEGGSSPEKYIGIK